MRCKAICVMTAVFLSAVISGTSQAQGLDVGEGVSLLNVGVRGGFSATDKDEDFEQYEAFVTYGLPWEWEWPSGWRLGTRLNASLGALDGGGETGVIGTIGPGLALSKAGIPLGLDIGIGFTGLSEDKFGREDFGTQFQFTSHIGVNYQFGWNLEAGYRFQHMSNAGIDEENPGLNLHMFQLGYRF